MNQSEALNVVRALANGVDPASGEVFPAERPYQRADIVRALFVASEALERSERFSRRREDLPSKAGQPWTEDEDRQLLRRFAEAHAVQVWLQPRGPESAASGEAARAEVTAIDILLPTMPAAAVPSFAFSARSSRCMLQGLPSNQTLAIPTCGLSKSSSRRPVA